MYDRPVLRQSQDSGASPVYYFHVDGTVGKTVSVPEHGDKKVVSEVLMWIPITHEPVVNDVISFLANKDGMMVSAFDASGEYSHKPKTYNNTVPLYFPEL